jgi:putative membrane protein
MTADTTDRQLVWIVLAIAAILFLLPAIGLGVGLMGAGSMMDGSWGHMWGTGTGTPTWLFLVGAAMRVLFLAVVIGGLYLAYRVLTRQDSPRDPAMQELRESYARGDLTDEEFERRRERLETDT